MGRKIVERGLSTPADVTEGIRTRHRGVSIDTSSREQCPMPGLVVTRSKTREKRQYWAFFRRGWTTTRPLVSPVPLTRKPLPSGQDWGECQVYTPDYKSSPNLFIKPDSMRASIYLLPPFALSSFIMSSSCSLSFIFSHRLMASFRLVCPPTFHTYLS